MAASNKRSRDTQEDNTVATADLDTTALTVTELRAALLAERSLRSQASDVLAIVAAFAERRSMWCTISRQRWDPPTNVRCDTLFDFGLRRWCTGICGYLQSTGRYSDSDALVQLCLAHPYSIRPDAVSLSYTTAHELDRVSWVFEARDRGGWVVLHRHPRNASDTWSPDCIATWNIVTHRAYNAFRIRQTESVAERVGFGPVVSVSLHGLVIKGELESIRTEV